MGETEDQAPQPVADAPIIIEDALFAEDAAALDAIAVDLDEPTDADATGADVPVADSPVAVTEIAEDAAADTEAATADPESPAEEADDELARLAADLDAEPAEAVADAADSLDDIPATPAVSEPDAEQAVVATAAQAVPWWPFLAYLGAWIVLAGLAAWQLIKLPTAQVAYESSAYGLMIIGGLVMTVVGPLLILAVWLTQRASRPASSRRGLLTSSLLKGATVTLIGAIIWCSSIVIVDMLRLGRPL